MPGMGKGGQVEEFRLKEAMVKGDYERT